MGIIQNKSPYETSCSPEILTITKVMAGDIRTLGNSQMAYHETRRLMDSLRWFQNHCEKKEKSRGLLARLKQAHEDYARLAKEKRVQDQKYNILYKSQAMVIEYNAKLQAELNEANETIERMRKENASTQESNMSVVLQENLDTKGCVESQLVSKIGEKEEEAMSSRGLMEQIKDNRDILTSHARNLSAMIEKYDKIIDEFPYFFDDFPELNDDFSYWSNEPELKMVAEMEKISFLKDQLGLPLAEVGLEEKVRACEIGFPRHKLSKNYTDSEWLLLNEKEDENI